MNVTLYFRFQKELFSCFPTGFHKRAAFLTDNPRIILLFHRTFSGTTPSIAASVLSRQNT
jgi:hypothetical protein